MKSKLLLTLLSMIFSVACYSQQEASGYMSGLTEPSAIISQGNILYVQGYNNLYKIDTALASPTASSIYSPAANFYMTNLTISGSIIYISEENYDEAADESFGCRIIALDLNNLSAPVNVIFTTTHYISSLTNKDSFIYFSSESEPDNADNFTVQIYKINISETNPPAILLVSNISANKEVNDMDFYNNNLLISVGGLGKVFGFDITDTVPVVTEYLNGLNFNKGLFINGSSLFLSEANVIGTKKLNITSSLTYVAQNTVYQDVNNGNPFFANFRDCVLIGDKLYMTLLNQGSVVMVQNSNFLANNEFDSTSISIHNSQNEVFIYGLDNNEILSLYNLSGQLLKTKNLTSNDNSIDISQYAKGMYILKLDNKTSFKFIK